MATVRGSFGDPRGAAGDVTSNTHIFGIKNQGPTAATYCSNHVARTNMSNLSRYQLHKLLQLSQIIWYPTGIYPYSYTAAPSHYAAV